jgi:hypothetical protein
MYWIFCFESPMARSRHQSLEDDLRYLSAELLEDNGLDQGLIAWLEQLDQIWPHLVD